jgi:hypothetical protein
VRSVAARIVALAVAVLACAWFALGVRQAHDTDAATSLIGAGGSAALRAGVAAHAASLLRAAGQLNPDRTVDLLRSQLDVRQGHSAQGRAVALSVTQAEPQNIQAWIAYGRASPDDPAGFGEALRHLNELAPPVGHGH